jgi:hypothetical protein
MYDATFYITYILLYCKARIINDSHLKYFVHICSSTGDYGNTVWLDGIKLGNPGVLIGVL